VRHRGSHRQPGGIIPEPAACGGVFVAGSLLWGVIADGFRPDRYDLMGAAICLVGVGVVMYAPRAGWTLAAAAAMTGAVMPAMGRGFAEEHHEMRRHLVAGATVHHSRSDPC